MTRSVYIASNKYTAPIATEIKAAMVEHGAEKVKDLPAFMMRHFQERLEEAQDRFDDEQL